MGNEQDNKKLIEEKEVVSVGKKKKKKNIIATIKKMKKWQLKLITIILLIMIIFVAGMVVYKNAITEKNAKIITKSTLEKIINVSDLSTYVATYNGITAVSSKTNPGEMDYYVSYEADVKAGFDFEKLDINVNNETKKITIIIPEIEITDINVYAESMDFIFTNKKANDETVTQMAYKACRKDVENESKKEQAIYDLAKQNAINVVKALTSPFIEQQDEDYILEVK